MQREQYFGKVARFSQDICRHAAHHDDAPAGTLAMARRALIGASAGVLCRLFAKPLAQTTTTGAREIRLEPRALWSGTVATETEIVCREGALWVTRGDARDYILRAGEMVRVERGAKVVVTGLGSGGVVGLQ